MSCGVIVGAGAVVHPGVVLGAGVVLSDAVSVPSYARIVAPVEDKSASASAGSAVPVPSPVGIVGISGVGVLWPTAGQLEEEDGEESEDETSGDEGRVKLSTDERIHTAFAAIRDVRDSYKRYQASKRGAGVEVDTTASAEFVELVKRTRVACKEVSHMLAWFAWLIV